MCSKVSDLVSFFESLDSSRDKKKNTSNKNATSNSMGEPRSGKVKNYGIELRGINQTPSEIRTTVNNVETNNNRIKKEKMETEEFYKLDSKTNKNHINHPRKEAENYSSTKVERKIYNDSESQNVEKFESKKRGLQLQNENSNFKENDKENEISNTSPKYVNRLSFKNINTEEYEDKVSDEIGSSMELEEEDIFGTNDFEENFEDNYAVETYNRNGGELIGLQIIRRSLNLNRNRSDKINPIKDSNVNLKDKHKDSKKSFENNYSIDSDTVQKPEKQKENVSAQAHKTNFDVKIGSSKIEEYEQPLVLDEFQPGKQYVKKFQQKKRISECPSQEKDKINDIIKELLQTEENYIYTLREAVEIYKPYLRSIERHNRIKNSWRVFGNIEKIYEHSKIFLASLTINCDTVDKIAQVFIDSESVFFDLYPKYAEHKPKSDYYIKEFEDVMKTKQKHLLSKLGLKDLLIAPIQRMPRYKEMLTKIQKELTRNNNSTEIINKAIDIIHQVTEKCNNSIKHNNIPERPKRPKNRLKRLNSRRLSNGSLPISSMLLNYQNAQKFLSKRQKEVRESDVAEYLLHKKKKALREPKTYGSERKK